MNVQSRRLKWNYHPIVTLDMTARGSAISPNGGKLKA